MTWNRGLVDDDLLFVAIKVGRVIAVSIALAVVAVEAIEALLDRRARTPCSAEASLPKTARDITLLF